MPLAVPRSLRCRWRPTLGRRGAATAGLASARAEFAAAVADIGVSDARELQLKARLAESIEELWQLRPALFELVARAHSEGEAWRRLLGLGRHFPTRSARSGFGALDAER